MQVGVQWIAIALAGCAGFFGSLSFLLWRQRRRVHQRLLVASGIGGMRDTVPLATEGLARKITNYAVNLGERISFGAVEPFFACIPGASDWLGRWFDRHSKTTGLGGLMKREGFCEARIRLASLCGAGAALGGAVFSNELCILGLFIGAFLGFRAPRWALSQEERARTEELERELPEMLEVVALGLRSGLSFDRSLRLYHGHFQTPFALGCASAQRQWEMGLSTREEALRVLGESYASPLLNRSIDSIVRSLRFGSSLADQLADAAAQARVEHCAKREEQVAKAPIKMMIPTGTLILPAMLILVLGPVLLELMEGF